MWDTIRKTSAPVLLMSVLLLLGVGYSIYKAATAFSVEVDSPAYDRTPSDVIVSPEIETVIPQNDPVAIRSEQGGFRLPDNALFQIASGTERIAQALEKGEITPNLLRAEGYTSRPDVQARYLADLYRVTFASRKGDMDRAVEIDSSVSSENYAQSLASFSLLPEDGSAVVSLSVYIGWERQGERWVPSAFSDSLL